MQHYYEMKRFEKDQFEVVVDRTYETLPIRDMFDDSCHEIAELERKVNDGTYSWFILRVRVLLDGFELGSHHLGACMYEDPMEVFKDGTVDDAVYAAMKEATAAASDLRTKLNSLSGLK